MNSEDQKLIAFHLGYLSPTLEVEIIEMDERIKDVFNILSETQRFELTHYLGLCVRGYNNLVTSLNLNSQKETTAIRDKILKRCLKNRKELEINEQLYWFSLREISSFLGVEIREYCNSNISNAFNGNA